MHIHDIYACLYSKLYILPYKLSLLSLLFWTPKANQNFNINEDCNCFQGSLTKLYSLYVRVCVQYVCMYVCRIFVGSLYVCSMHVCVQCVCVCVQVHIPIDFWIFIFSECCQHAASCTTKCNTRAVTQLQLHTLLNTNPDRPSHLAPTAPPTSPTCLHFFFPAYLSVYLALRPMDFQPRSSSCYSASCFPCVSLSDTSSPCTTAQRNSSSPSLHTHICIYG